MAKAHAAPRVVWITGASSGIGRALALTYARDGAVVAISARSRTALDSAAAEHPNIRPYPLDVSDAQATLDTAQAIERDLGPIDLAVLNAGVWHPMTASGFDTAKITQSMSVNYLGLIHPLAHLVPAMTGRTAGHIAIVSSVAGYVGLPRSLAYGPSKAAAIHLAECLYSDLARYGVAVSLINPGFVDTPMTAVNTFPMPWLMTVDDAVRRIRKGLDRRKFEIAFPWQLAGLLKTMKRLPYGAAFWMIRTFLAPK